MLLGYNTNGFSHHTLEDSVEIIAEIGYKAIGLTLDVHHLNPFSTPEAQVHRFGELLARLKLSSVVETGARFILDRRRKHSPTLLDGRESERTFREDFHRKCIDIAHQLSAESVSFWSGTAQNGESDKVLEERLVEQCKRLCDYAERTQTRLAFEPEPGMFIDTTEKFAELHRRVNHPLFGLTLDVGHLVCMKEPLGESIRIWKDWLWNVHLDDMKPGVHDHLMFGEGEVDFQEVFGALKEIGYRGPACVELSRHAHDAVRTAERSMGFLKRHVN